MSCSKEDIHDDVERDDGDVKCINLSICNSIYIMETSMQISRSHNTHTCVARQNIGWTEEEVRDWLLKNGFEEESQLFEGW